MEFAPGGELFARLTEEGPYAEQEARGIFAQIASAVEYMVSRFAISSELLKCQDPQKSRYSSM